MSKTIIAIIIIIVIGFLVFYQRKGANLSTIKPEPSAVQNNMTTPTQTTAKTQETQAIPKQYSAYPQMIIDQNKNYTVSLETTKGNLKIKLFPQEVPKTVNNFVFLTKEGFYDGTKFHRIIKGFMIQGGDPQGDGTGGPGYQFTDEPVTRDYKRGIVAMANSGPNTNGSQFFIMHQDNNLPKNYTIFGEVVEGMDVVDKIAETPVGLSSQGELSVPQEEVKIIKASVGVI